MSYLSHLESLIDEEAFLLFFESLEKRGWKSASLSRLRKAYIHSAHLYNPDYSDQLKLTLREFLRTRKRREELGLSKEYRNKKLLFLCTNSPQAQIIDFGKELNVIKNSIGEHSFLSPIKLETDVNQASLAVHLSKYQSSYIHIALHASKTRGILWADSAKEDYYPVEAFVELFKGLGSKPELVLLSACHSFHYAEALSPYVKKVIGMKDFWPDEAASQYAKFFYAELDRSVSVESAHRAALEVISNNEELLEIHRRRKIETPLAKVPVLY